MKVVYIAASSFSGSTLLGLLLGSQPQAMYAGEVNNYLRRTRRQEQGHSFCSCGASREHCPFWSLVCSQYPSEPDLNPAPGLSWRNVRLVVRALLVPPGHERHPTTYGSLVGAIHGVASAERRDLLYVVDSSKSIAGLDALARSPGVELYVIHLVRNGVDVVGSYKRRGAGVWYAAIAWTVFNVFLSLYAKRGRFRTMRLGYRRLCLETGTECERLNSFLGTDLELDSLVEAVSSTDYHVMGGNMPVSRAAASFEGIRFRTSRRELNALERLVVVTLAGPLNWVLGA
jgi:hypothetical protein